jgi:hypothetical protein
MTTPPVGGDRTTEAAAPRDEDTGLPGLKNWRAVYVAVFVTFVAWIALLTWLTEAYA